MALTYVLILFFLGLILTIQMGPGEIYYYDLNGRTHPDIHYHTIYPEWLKLWCGISFLSLPAAFIFVLLPIESSSNLD